MSEFVIKIRALTDNLTTVGDLIRDRKKIEFVADGLGLEFRPFLSSVYSQPKMLFEDFIHLVVREEIFLLRHGTSFANPAPTSATFAAKGKSFNGNRDNSSHDYYDNQTQKNNGKSKNNRWHRTMNNPVVCQLCDTASHPDKTCRKSGRAINGDFWG